MLTALRAGASDIVEMTGDTSDRATRRARMARDGTTSAATIHGVLQSHVLERAMPIAVIAAISSGVLLNGYNSALGNATACLVMSIVVIGQLLIEPPSPHGWRRSAPALVVACAASAWPIFAALLRPPLAPDLFTPQMLGVAAGLLALLSGWMMGLRPQLVPTAAHVLMAFNSLYLFAGLVMRSVNDGSTLDYWTLTWHGRFSGTIGNVNATAVVAGTCIAMSTAYLLSFVAGNRRTVRGMDRLRIAFLALCLLVSTGAMLITASRVAALVTAVLTGLMVAWTVLRHRRRLRRIAPALVVAIGVLLIVVTLFSGDLLTRYNLLSRESGMRRLMWSHYWDLVQASPWLGYGAGSFPALNARTLGSVSQAEVLWSVNSAHDIVLQLLLAAGIPYLALMVVAAALIATPIMRQVHSGVWSIGMTGIAASIAVVVAVATIDIALDIPATTILMLFLVGLLWGGAMSYDAAPRRARQRKSSGT